VREINGYYCDECFDDHRPIIQSYHTQKDYGDIHFYGDESRKDAIFMGFELELEQITDLTEKKLQANYKADLGISSLMKMMVHFRMVLK
jgi:hypothetical protein